MTEREEALKKALRKARVLLGNATLQPRDYEQLDECLNTIDNLLREQPNVHS